MKKRKYKQQTLFDQQTMDGIKKKPVEAPKVPVDESDIKTETVHTNGVLCTAIQLWMLV
jgi:hypothetical protein